MNSLKWLNYSRDVGGPMDCGKELPLEYEQNHLMGLMSLKSSTDKPPTQLQCTALKSDLVGHND